jgi:hypothetical protein
MCWGGVGDRGGQRCGSIFCSSHSALFVLFSNLPPFVKQPPTSPNYFDYRPEGTRCLRVLSSGVPWGRGSLTVCSREVVSAALQRLLDGASPPQCLTRDRFQPVSTGGAQNKHYYYGRIKHSFCMPPTTPSPINWPLPPTA